MKITILDCSEGEEEEIIIKCRNLDEQLLRTIYALKSGRDKITVSKEDKLMQIQPRDIYYFEAVDNRVFVYMEKEVYETKLKLMSWKTIFRIQIFSGLPSQRSSIWFM